MQTKHNPPLLSKQPPYPAQHAVLLRVIWVVFARDFEDGREGGGVCIDAVSYPVRDLFTIHCQPAVPIRLA